VQFTSTCFKLLFRRLAWLLGVSLGVLLAAQAQAQTYAYRADTFSYDPPSGAASSVVWHNTSPSPACTGYPNGDDDWADINFPAGFTFTFGGTAYSSVRVYSNGILAFPTDVSGAHRDYTSQALPITTAPGAYTGCVNAVPQRLMVPYWLDIVAGTANGTAGASIQYELLGTAPNRRFVISWVNVKLYSDTIRYNFQVVLQQSAVGVNGNFKYQYTTGSSTGANAAVGVQLSTTDFTQYAFNQNFIDTTLGTAILWYPANQLAAKSAEYRFDENSWSGAANEIKDTSGNLRHATLVTNNVANVAGGKLCRGATFTNNTSNAIRDAIATPITPGDQGAVDFWFKSNNAWNSTDAMLLDATTTAARPFFLLKRSNGALRFSVTDSAGTVHTANTSTAYTFAASSWQHIAVSWSLKAGTNQTVLQIMVNGVLAGTTGTTPFRTTSSGTIAALSTLYIGDNRTSGVTPSGGSPNGANGTLDEVYMYAQDINATQAAADMALTRPTCTSFNHFHIVHAGSYTGCGATNVTVEAHDASHSLFNLSGTTVAMSTSTGHGTWSSVSTTNPVTSGAGNGIGSYTFANESSVVFGLSNTFTESLNINLNSGGITENSGTASTCTAADYTFGSVCDANLSFTLSCLFDAVESGAVPPAAPQTRLFTKLAGTAFTVDVLALTNASTVDTDFVGTVAVDLVDSSATSCPTGSGLNTATNITFVDTDGGRKPVSITYANAAPNTRVRMKFGSATPTCSSDNFSIRPSQLAVTTPTLTNATLAGIPKAIAGSAFTLNAAAGVTSGYTGTPTINTTLVQDHAAVAIASGTLTGVFSPGTGATASGAAFKYLDVGNIKFLANAVVDSGFTAVDQTVDCVAGSDSNTLSGGKYGCNIGSAASATMGRWYPSHYSFTGALAPACVLGGFTYMDQDALGVALTVKAHASTGGTAAATDPVTSRYTTGYPNLASVTISGDNGGTAVAVTRLGSPVFPTMPNNTLWTNGLFQIADTFAFTKLSAGPDGAYDLFKLKAALTDLPGGDGSLLLGPASAQETNATRVRYGRIQLRNAYGSEFLALPIPIEIQFWNGTWQRNAIDNCTVIPPSAFSWDFPNGTVPQPNNLAACETRIDLSGAAPLYTLNLPAPGAGNAGWADLTLNLGDASLRANSQCTAVGAAGANDVPTNMKWLQFNWRTLTTAENPRSRATFGTFRSPLIYRRENY
jgi:MSHA biogenesis protein MshQ